ncbi:MAG: aminopeptidase N C-terminal domain-containing protein, partial [Pseudomonadota bacterium]
HLSPNTSPGGSAAAAKPVPSLLRGFSAPVILDFQQPSAEREVLLAHDTDPFNRWEAGRSLAKEVLLARIQQGREPSAAWLAGLAGMLTDTSLDPAFRSLAIGLPSEDDLAQTLHEDGQTPDPDAIKSAIEDVARARATYLEDTCRTLYVQMQVTGPYSPDAGPAGKRDLGNAMLSMLTWIDGGEMARAQFQSAENMTQSRAALALLCRADAAEDALATFYDRWKHERFVIDAWFGLQVGYAKPEVAAAKVRELREHPDFTMKTPNRFRALFGSFIGNTCAFHRADGSGYTLVADTLMELDAINPQTTARMTSAFSTWRRYDADRQGLMRAALERVAGKPGLSRDTTEMVTRLLA